MRKVSSPGSVRLTRRFYSRETIEVARALLGRTLYHASAEGTTAGRIVEVEAYLGSVDPGSHAFKGPTPRNRIMFGPAGYLYVYFTYGMHYCANVVTGKEGAAGAVLLRAVEPLIGLDLMAERRGTDDKRLLARGPARLSQAFAFGRDHNGLDLVDGPAWVGRTTRIKGEIRQTPRIGLKPGMDQPWRFVEKGPWASGKS
ncbi:MAG TPA: DNA-3-methyladenine glycosylase [Actinomycetota bacterium]|nr:DNA-3-methyladenine glycosylase [Actinomycetota bacterium]